MRSRGPRGSPQAPLAAVAACAATLLLLVPATVGLAPVPDLPGPEASPYDEVPVPWNLAGPGERAVLHVHPVQGSHQPTALFVLEDVEGNAVAYAAATSRLYISDGYDANGALRAFIEAGRFVDGWQRIDATVSGDTYTVSVDGREATTARTLTPANEVRFGERDELQALLDGPGDEISIARPRILPDEATMTTFGPADHVGWSPFTTGQGDVDVRSNTWGHQSLGKMEATTPRLVPGPHVGYVHEPVPQADAYLLEASFRPYAVGLEHAHGVPDHQAVLSGIAGPLDEPTVHWALVIAPTNDTIPHLEAEHDRWSLFLVDADGHRTQLGPAWGTTAWHHVLALVDEAADAITVHLDQGDTALRFTFDDLPSSDRVATGDVFTGQLGWTGQGTGVYDELGITPWDTGP